MITVVYYVWSEPPDVKLIAREEIDLDEALQKAREMVFAGKMIVIDRKSQPMVDPKGRNRNKRKFADAQT